MANTTIQAGSSTLNDIIAPTVQEAMFVASETSIMKNLVKNYTVPANSGVQLQIPIYPTQTAQDLTEGTDMDGASSDVAVSTNVATIDLKEVGIMTTVSDMAVNYGQTQVIQDLGKLFGEAVAKKMDQKLTGLFSGFSTFAHGSATDSQSELTAEALFKAAAILRDAAVPGPYYGVFNPKQIFALKRNLTNTFVNPNASTVVNQAMTEGYVGRIAGIDIFESSNVVADSATSAVSGVFARDALGLAMAQDIKINLQRDESKRATEVVCTAVFGVKEIHDTYGVKLVADATIGNES